MSTQRLGSSSVIEVAAHAHGEQLKLELDWGREPWSGVSPRHLTRGSCVVDKSEVGCPSREALRFAVNPAQLQLCISTSFKKGGFYMLHFTRGGDRIPVPPKPNG